VIRCLVVALCLVASATVKGAPADTLRLPTAWQSTLPSEPSFRYALRDIPRVSLVEHFITQLKRVFSQFLQRAAQQDVGVVFFVVGLVIVVITVAVVSRRSGGVPIIFGARAVVRAGAVTVEHMDEENLDRAIGTAESKGDYRMAVRYHLLHILREMQDAGIIEWRAERTNRDYLRMLTALPLKQAFGEVVGIAERLWYGYSTIDKNEYESIVPQFSALRRQVRGDTAL